MPCYAFQTCTGEILDPGLVPGFGHGAVYGPLNEYIGYLVSYDLTLLRQIIPAGYMIRVSDKQRLHDMPLVAPNAKADRRYKTYFLPKNVFPDPRKSSLSDFR